MMELVYATLKLFGQGIPCLFQLITGLYCPGCGGTRAVRYLLHGQLQKSIQYHPLVLYMALVALLEGGSWALAKICGNPKLYIRHYEVATYIGIVIIVFNFCWKNYMLVVRGIDLLP
ncbi:MAG: DUF2752 domain-containing protein [Hungatella sp.]